MDTMDYSGPARQDTSALEPEDMTELEGEDSTALEADDMSDFEADDAAALGPDVAAESAEVSETRLEAPIEGSLGIADVLFPAKPPVPLNVRLIRGLSFHDEAKPRGLAGAAGIFASSWEPGYRNDHSGRN